MSAPSRGRGGGVARGPATTPSTRGSSRAAFSNTSRGRGRGRGSTSTSTPGNANGEGILQKLRTGTLQRNGDGPQANARGKRNNLEEELSGNETEIFHIGRGSTARGQSNATRAKGSTARSSRQSPTPRSQISTPTPATTSNYRDFTNQMSEKYNLVSNRESLSCLLTMHDHAYR